MRKLFQNWTRKAWLAISLQERRRARQSVTATPNAPVITTGGYQWDVTTPGWADLWINWTFAHGTCPVASLEIWLSSGGGAFALFATVTSTAWFFEYLEATNTTTVFQFKLRYRNGGTLGPFSNVYEMETNVE